MKCWSCGEQLHRFGFTCPACKNIRESQKIQDLIQTSIDSSAKQNAEANASIVILEQRTDANLSRHLRSLATAVSSNLDHLASIVEWGNQRLLWQLEQQSSTLQSIEIALKKPSDTRASELRENAEECVKRGAIDDAITLFRQALEYYLLDYRTYVGLAQAYLQKDDINEAISVLERSLPYAPTGDFNYKSYSLRLIGHAQACLGRYDLALKSAEEATALSPDYADALYDKSQYLSQLGRSDDCLLALEHAIRIRPLYYSLARYERNFANCRREVDVLLDRISERCTSDARHIYESTLTVLNFDTWHQADASKRNVFQKQLGEVERELRDEQALRFDLIATEETLNEARRILSACIEQMSANKRAWTAEIAQLTSQQQSHENRNPLFDTWGSAKGKFLPGAAFLATAIILNWKAGAVVAVIMFIVLVGIDARARRESIIETHETIEPIRGRLLKIDASINYAQSALTGNKTNKRLLCRQCNASIHPDTAAKNFGLCVPCSRSPFARKN